MALAGRGMAEVAVEAVGMRKKGKAGHGRQYTRQYMAALIKQVNWLQPTHTHEQPVLNAVLLCIT
jgi:hypothetical protein